MGWISRVAVSAVITSALRASDASSHAPAVASAYGNCEHPKFMSKAAHDFPSPSLSCIMQAFDGMA